MNRLLSTGLATVCGAVCILTVASCGGSGSGTRGITLAKLGEVNSSAFNLLRGIVDTSGSSNIAGAEILAIDGDAHSPGSIWTQPQVREQWNLGRYLLFVDLQPAHMDRDLKALLGTALPTGAHAVIARKTRDAAGRPHIQILGFRKSSNEAAPPELKLRRFVKSAADYFERTRNAPPTETMPTPPDGLTYVTYDYAELPFGAIFDQTRNGNKQYSTNQFSSVDVTQRFILFLENGQIATGDNQILVQETSVEASPVTPGEGTTSLLALDSGGAFSAGDIGWFQVELDLASEPQTPSAWSFQGNSPQNANAVTTVESSLSFGINFTNPFSGGGGVFNYTSSTTRELTAWKVVNASGGVNSSWNYLNQNPWMANNPNNIWTTDEFGGGVSFTGALSRPNDLALNQLQAATKTALQTANVETGTQTINTSANMVWINVFNGSLDKTLLSSTLNETVPYDVCLNMATVVPIPIASLTFGPNPVPVSAGQATGTITLQGFAQMDTTFYVKSLSPNATVLSTTQVDQFSEQGTFQVLINGNGLSPGQSTVATIQISNGAYEAQAQLTIQN